MPATIARALVRALLKAWMDNGDEMGVACECGRACVRVSPVRMITVVVPSPTCRPIHKGARKVNGYSFKRTQPATIQISGPTPPELEAIVP